MRPDDPGSGFDDLLDAGLDVPFDAAIERIDADLEEAGEQARRMLYGRSHPTRVFTYQLRARLLGPGSMPDAELASS